MDRLKAEMAHVTGEVQAKEQGVRTLESVDRQLSASGVCNTEDVSVLLEEMKKSQGNIVLKEREREEFIQTLVKLRENLSTKESSEVSIRFLFSIRTVYSFTRCRWYRKTKRFKKAT